VAVQRWIHDLALMARMPAAARDAVVGRALDTNEELPDAPPSAHVKRTAQESFEPAAFMVRRSMPYGGLREHGLYFVAFVEALDRFDRMMRRMAGVEDGIVDGLFAYSRPATGGYYFCPPVRAGRLDLRGVG
jgi:putative iron-dependent peroxidase